MGNMPSLDKVSSYYSKKLGEHGATPSGVDWGGSEGQQLRFEALARVFSITDEKFSVNDIGCGYGAMLDFLVEKGLQVDYLGVDISPSMVEIARQMHPETGGSRFILGNLADRVADYTIASGIFNVKLDANDKDWESYIWTTLQQMFTLSNQGIAFNFLPEPSKEKQRREHLYYSNPEVMRHYCLINLSKEVTLLSDYGLFDCTILVRKTF